MKASFWFSSLNVCGPQKWLTSNGVSPTTDSELRNAYSCCFPTSGPVGITPDGQKQIAPSVPTSPSAEGRPPQRRGELLQLARTSSVCDFLLDLDDELPPRTLQTFAGHASLQITMNRYGLLFRSERHNAAKDAFADGIKHRLPERFKNQDRKWSDNPAAAHPGCRQWLQGQHRCTRYVQLRGEAKMPFEINDALSFEENLTAFAKSLETDDPKLAAVLAQKLPELLTGRIQQSNVWDALETASWSGGTGDNGNRVLMMCFNQMQQSPVD